MVKNQIFWSAWACDKGFAAIALTEQHGHWMSLDVNDSIEFFSNCSEVVQHMTQANKPSYFEMYGSNYELSYLPATSAGWQRIYGLWLRPDQEAVDHLICRLVGAPTWYDRLLPWIKCLKIMLKLRK